MASSRPPSGMVSYPNTGEPESLSSASFSNKQTMQQKMLRQRQLSLERQRNAAKSTFVAVKAQEKPICDGYGRPPSLPPRTRNVVDATAALEATSESRASPGAGGTTQLGASVAGLGDIVDQVDANPLPRCKTADSSFSNVSVLLNEGDGQPGIGQGITDKPPMSDAATWDLTVNTAARPQPSRAVAATDAAENGGKKWWKPSLPFRGNRGESAEPPVTRSGDINGVTSEAISFDRSGVRTPDSTERTFHGPGKRSPQRGGGYGRPPMPERRSPVQDIPGGIFDADVDVRPADLRPRSGGSAAGRSSSVPARQPSPGRRPSGLAVHSPSGVAFGGVSAFASSPSVASSQPPSGPKWQGASTTDTDVCNFYAEDVAKASPTPVEALARDASPSPLLGEEPAKKGGRRGWRPWRAQKDASAPVQKEADIAREAPTKQEPVCTDSNVVPFTVDE